MLLYKRISSAEAVVSFDPLTDSLGQDVLTTLPRFGGNGFMIANYLIRKFRSDEGGLRDKCTSMDFSRIRDVAALKEICANLKLADKSERTVFSLKGISIKWPDSFSPDLFGI